MNPDRSRLRAAKFSPLGWAGRTQRNFHRFFPPDAHRPVLAREPASRRRRHALRAAHHTPARVQLVIRNAWQEQLNHATKFSAAGSNNKALTVAANLSAIAVSHGAATT